MARRTKKTLSHADLHYRARYADLAAIDARLAFELDPTDARFRTMKRAGDAAADARVDSWTACNPAD